MLDFFKKLRHRIHSHNIRELKCMLWSLIGALVCFLFLELHIRHEKRAFLTKPPSHDNLDVISNQK